MMSQNDKHILNSYDVTLNAEELRYRSCNVS